MSVARVERVPYAAAGFGGTLLHDLARGIPAAQPFFPTRTWQDVARQIDAQAYPREELARVLEESARKFGAPEPVLENIRRLKQPRTYAVVTGQQPGFLGGPLYTLFKALSAVSLARQLTAEAAGAAQFVPVFWVAEDDHDLAEIDHVYLLLRDGALKRVRADLPAGSVGRSACDVSVDAGSLAALRVELLEALPAANVDAYLELFRGRSVADAFTALLYGWLGGLGLILAPSRALRVFNAPLLVRELDGYDVTARLIQEAGVALRAAGYDAGISPEARVAPHFFIEMEPSRVRVRLRPVRDAGGVSFRAHSPALETLGQTARTFSKSELAELIRQRPVLFSAAAALRPVLQQLVFPCVAAVLGPGEIAYWAQLTKVSEHYGAVWPMVVPRATLTLVDALGQKALRKLDLESVPAAWLSDVAELDRRAARSGGAGASLDRHGAAMLAEFDALAAEVQAVDGGLNPLFKKSRERIAHELERVAEKTRASLEQREGSGAGRARYLATLLRPKNRPQERVLGAAQFIAARPALPEELLEVISPLPGEHLLVTL